MEALLKRFAFQILHHEERLAVLLADVIHRADAGVIQTRSGLRLSPETVRRDRIACKPVRKELDRNKSLKPAVLGFVHDTHAAAPEFFENHVVGDSQTDWGARAVKPVLI